MKNNEKENMKIKRKINKWKRWKMKNEEEEWSNVIVINNKIEEMKRK